MTVAELIEMLNSLDDDQKQYAVEAEGCDCNGEAIGISVVNMPSIETQYVLIARTSPDIIAPSDAAYLAEMQAAHERWEAARAKAREEALAPYKDVLP